MGVALLIAVGLAVGPAVAPVAGSATDPTAGRAADAPATPGPDRPGPDPLVRPQDDLFLATNGAWLRETAIPDDRSSWGNGALMRDRTDAQLHALVEELAARPAAAGSGDRKLADFHRAYLDVATIDGAGLAPVAPSLTEIDELLDKRELIALMGRWQGMVDMPLTVDIEPDLADPDVYAASYDQAGLGMPDRDYYLRDDPRSAATRAAYVAYLDRLFALAGDPDSAAHAAREMALETSLAAIQWPRDRLGNLGTGYNPRSPLALGAAAPGIDWATFAAAAQLPAGGLVIVHQPSYVAALARLIQTASLADWRLYLRARRLDGAAATLPAGFRSARFEFHGRAVQGLVQDSPRWRRALRALDAALGEALGQRYVERCFPPEARGRVQAMVATLVESFAAAIGELAWMTPATQAAAREKLSRMTLRIGYPDRWRHYDALEIRADDALGNRDRSGHFEYHRRAVRAGRPVDRDEWDMTPQTVNAAYLPSRNQIVFPAAILQAPYFDPAADDAVNFGGIGAVIGHEISHAFDDQGSRFDGLGRLRDWWSTDDRHAFDAITQRLVAQYGAYEVLPGQHVDGRLTLSENIADVAGLAVAFRAYESTLHGRPSPVVDGLSGERRFFHAWARALREKVREARARQLSTIDNHAPAWFRVDGAAVDNDGFHRAFGTRPGDGMYVAPEMRVRPW